MDQQIICFGEMLWDRLPSGDMPGGAPMNVAIHLTYNGISPLFISRIGNDVLGKKLVEVLKEKGIATSHIQVDNAHPTSIVKANIDNKREVSYEIPPAVSWDYIAYDEQVAKQIAQSKLFIYGSLASRSKATYDTLTKYIALAELKVYDINLRPPHYSPKLIEQLLSYADIVKMNHYELIEIMSWFGKVISQTEAMEYIKMRYKLDKVLITRGEKGAILLDEKGFVEHRGYRVEVADTIGSGDAFLAAFLSKMLKGEGVSQALAFAGATGALVATKSGAIPQFSDSYILNFIKNYSGSENI
ncbi:carbohydrate kinase [Rhodocytophaga aerolata]|uniref:Carbohydrate kinase n=1 Tax=Rhodocytophaga aerolata TaxID=455078 RepID=A0ABT8R2V9_9BACT|nr:carbohydrate kinase [Rhodocytophaga aerolata]MDO1446437.1 carbohydrate kinase [Rhodocytophaga aerolata]